MNKGPSKNLTWKELACKDGTPYPTKWINTRALEVSDSFEIIRAAFGNKPIRILSAYRSPAHNKKIGGARHSQHMNGRALDLMPPEGVNVLEFFNVIKKFAKETKIRGIGLYETFVHIDTRPSDNLVIWNGKGTKDSK